MSDTLMGKEISGTPIESRRTARGADDLFSQFLTGMLRGGGLTPGRLGAESFSNLLDFNLGDLNLGGAASDLLADPRSQTSGLFAALQPFEAEETSRQVSGLRNAFGTVGGRFSRNLAEGEGALRSRLAGEFARNREQAILQANQQRLGAFNTIIQAALQGDQNALQLLSIITSFGSPGQPGFQQGLLPSLISAGGNIAAAKFLA